MWRSIGLSLVASLVMTSCASNSKVTPPSPNPEGKYGSAEFETANPQDLRKKVPTPGEVLLHPSAAPVVVQSKVTEVCRTKGCWMKVESAAGPLRVTFEDYAFFVPVELVGKEVAMKGKYIVYRETVAEQKHLLEDAGKSKAEIDAVTAEREVLRFKASGVRVLN